MASDCGGPHILAATREAEGPSASQPGSNSPSPTAGQSSSPQAGGGGIPRAAASRSFVGVLTNEVRRTHRSQLWAAVLVAFALGFVCGALFLAAWKVWL